MQTDESETGDGSDPRATRAARRGRKRGRKSVGLALIHAARLHRGRLGDRLSALGLFPGQDAVLEALAAEGPLTVGALADVLRVRSPTASKAVSRLTALGLVERRTERDAEPGIRRLALVALTEEGEAKAKAVHRLGREVERDLLAGFASGERKRLSKLLRRVARNLVAAGATESAEPEAGEAA